MIPTDQVYEQNNEIIKGCSWSDCKFFSLQKILCQDTEPEETRLLRGAMSQTQISRKVVIKYIEKFSE